MNVMVKGLLVAAGSAVILVSLLTGGPSDVVAGDASVPASGAGVKSGGMAERVERLVAQESELLDYRQKELTAWMDVNMAAGFVPGNYPADWHAKIVRNWGWAIHLIEIHRAEVLSTNAQYFDNTASCEAALSSYHGAPFEKLKASYQEFVGLPGRIKVDPYAPIAAPAGSREVASQLHMAYIRCATGR